MSLLVPDQKGELLVVSGIGGYLEVLGVWGSGV